VQRIVADTEYGEQILIEANPEDMKELTRFPALDRKCWNNFAIMDGVIYLRNDREMTSIDIEMD
jgi:hypothetical protein